VIKEDDCDNPFPIDETAAISESDLLKDEPRKKTVEGQKRWMWTREKLNDLLDSVITFKTKMTSKNLEFEANKILFYSEVREMMAALYPESDFGPISDIAENIEDMTDSERKEYERRKMKEDVLIKEGYNRVKTKVKEIRANYNTVVGKGIQSLPYKRTMLEHFDKIKMIWGQESNPDSVKANNAIHMFGKTSRSHQPLINSAQSFRQCRKIAKKYENTSLNKSLSSFESDQNSVTAGIENITASSPHNPRGSVQALSMGPSTSVNNTYQVPINNDSTPISKPFINSCKTRAERTITMPYTPTAFIKKLTSGISTKSDEKFSKSGLRNKDLVEMQLAKEELQIFRETCEVMKKNSEANAEAMRAFTQSITQLGQNIKDGFAMLSEALITVQTGITNKKNLNSE